MKGELGPIPTPHPPALQEPQSSMQEASRLEVTGGGRAGWRLSKPQPQRTAFI